MSLGDAITTAIPVLSTPTEVPVPDGLERVDIDPDYAARRGYDPQFLGVPVPLPVLDEEQRRNAAKNARAGEGQDAAVLPYHHFSIVMNRRRQLAYYTAVNIDGAQAKQPKRDRDTWYFDPRIAESEQIGEALYARNALDRGHLVRRLDPAWGVEALQANNDTFHFTNCSPQHADFNQNSETWLGIEDYLLGVATGLRRRLTIFTGPVMTEEDPLYRGIRLPRHFWKIAAYVGDDGALTVSAFLLGQEGLLGGLERFNPSTWQVSVGEIIARTGLDFSALLPSEVAMTARPGLEAMEEGGRRRLDAVSDIVAF
ncbi:DNA/RNA non-specific endonuclease [Pseudoduganella umbonata]|uniref:Endonuclease G n=1 Tax=Pseudoduganella umbonata TaxID=864828 RepID=A0A7W5EAE2_9BURK|nr:DNA/RNA non-specific endonuclease [Pseudoduganella umbonata]MBB3221684.1 endonuclease G [Pseudoduganella umbonata]